MPDYDKLAAQFGGSAGSGDLAPQPDKYDLAAQKFGGAVAGGSSASSAPAQRAAPASAAQRVQAAGAGVNRGFFSDLLGIPVNTAANVLDLGKAGIGYAASKVTGHAPPEWTEPMDRAKVVGSSEWIARKIGEGAKAVGAQSPVDAARPDDAVSRVLFAGGRGAGASIVPNPRAALSAGMQLTNAGMGGISGLASGSVGEVKPEWAGVAGMLPSLGVAAGAAGIQRAVRGGEAGRRAMEQRLQDLRNGGIENPSVGLASGNSTISGIENLLAQTPGSSGLYARSGAANVAGMKAKTEALRDSISSEFGPVAAGSAIQGDLKGTFRDRVNATTRTLNDKVAREVGPNFYAMPENTLATASGMSAVNPAAPATSQALQNGRIAGVSRNLASDVQGTPMPGNPLMNEPTRYMRADGQVMDAPPGIPFGTLKNLRTSIGEEANSPAILGTPEGKQFKGLYGAMSQDMRQAVGGADRLNAGVDVGPLLPSQLPASMALNRANSFYSRAATRAEDLNGLANRNTPEGAYGAVTSSLNSGPSLYGKLRGAVAPETRQKLAATVVDQLGTAKPGQQSAAGDEWSPSTFLTNYSKLYQNGGGEALFKRLPGGQKQADQLADIAKTAEMVGKSSKVWANPSGTAPALSARGTVATLTAGWFLNPMVAGSTTAGLAGANQLSQRLLLNPKFVNWLAKAPNVPPDQVQAHMQRLMTTAGMTRDPQFQQDATDYLNLVQSGNQE